MCVLMNYEPQTLGSKIWGASANQRAALVAALVLCAGCLGACQNPNPNLPYLEWQVPATAEAKRCVSQCETNRWRCTVRQSNERKYCQTQARLNYSGCEADQRVSLNSCISTLQNVHGENWQAYTGQCAAFTTHSCRLASCSTASSCQHNHDICFFECGGRLKLTPVVDE